jgi:photosystem II stability/assembly factor-like uncharacterized protein
MYLKKLLMTLAAASVLAAQGAPAANALPDPIDRPALMVRAPAKAFLVSVARAGKRLVAVGEHGLVTLSDDGGASWRQAKVPTSVTLTAVQFPSPTRGWAVGHAGVILHSEDGGETWTRQLDGVRAAQLVLQEAQAGGRQDAKDARYLAEAERLVHDGPDKPFLALYFSDERQGYAVGAYNLAFRTRDGGKTWAPCMRGIDNPKGNHLYAVQGRGDTVFIAGEQGLVLRSTNGGQSFERLDTGYKGSFFALATAAANDVVVAGLRGNAYRSADGGSRWEKIEIPVPASITAISAAPNGSLLMASQAGLLLTVAPGARAAIPIKMPSLPPLNDVLLDADGGMLVVSMFGAMRLPPAANVSTHHMAAK